MLYYYNLILGFLILLYKIENVKFHPTNNFFQYYGINNN